jgi:3-deoxy-D-manno-octulosonic-acid transferase
VRRLRERMPRQPLVLSTTTLTGRAVAQSDLGADVATLLPVDALRIVDRVFRRVRPRLVILVETELWPGILRAAAAVGAPVAMVSGRLRRERWRATAGRAVFRAALARVAAFGMQSAEDAERIIALGAARDRVRVTGNLKASAAPLTAAPPLAGLDARRVVVAASTQPGEEAFVLQAFAAMRRVHRDALLLLAPRRPERFDEVAQRVAAAGLPMQRRSARAGAVAADVQVLLLDTVGELVRFFPAAWAVFVGGTVAPLGGHNVLEPAAYAKPVVFGPHTENVAAAAAALCAAGAAAVVRTPSELAEYWARCSPTAARPPPPRARPRRRRRARRRAGAHLVDARPAAGSRHMRPAQWWRASRPPCPRRRRSGALRAPAGETPAATGRPLLACGCLHSFPGSRP